MFTFFFLTFFRGPLTLPCGPLSPVWKTFVLKSHRKISVCCVTNGRTRDHFLTSILFCNCPTVVSLSLKWKGTRLSLKWRPTQAMHFCTFLAMLPTTWQDLKSSTRELMAIFSMKKTCWFGQVLIHVMMSKKEVLLLSPVCTFYSLSVITGLVLFIISSPISGFSVEKSPCVLFTTFFLISPSTESTHARITALATGSAPRGTR